MEQRGVQIIESVPPSAVTGLSKFIEVHYLVPNTPLLQGGAYNEGSLGTQKYLSWTIDPGRSAQSRYPVSAPLTVKVTLGPGGVLVEFPGLGPAGEETKAVRQRVADDVEIISTSFLEHAKRTSLHFVFPLETGVKTKYTNNGGVGREVLKRIFAGNMVNLYLMLMALSFLFILLLGDYALVGILFVQGLMLFLSDRLVQGAGVVRVTGERQDVALVRVMSTPEVIKAMARAGRKAADSVREHVELAASTGRLDDPATKEAIHRALKDSGVPCTLADVQVTQRNPFAIVSRVAERFHLPVPKIVVVNTPADNASATGVSPGHAAMTITAGALEDLTDPELESVVGHEFGHIRGRDPIILFFVTSVMYLGGLFLWLPVLLTLGFFYFILAFAIVYLVGKFLETKADTESVMVLGQPRLLASALTRIGFTQLYYERYSSQARFMDWLRFDPHPPIYFRVTRLARMAEKGTQIHHALADSVRDVISGFFLSLVGMG